MIRKPSEWMELLENNPVGFIQQVFPVVLSSIAIPAAILALVTGSSVIGPTAVMSALGM